MHLNKVTYRTIPALLLVLLGALIVAWNPLRIKIAFQPYQANAMSAEEVSIDERTLKIDDRRFDLKPRPALFIDSTCLELLSAYTRIPAERRPYLIVSADSQPDFMPPDMVYFWSSNTGTRSPALVWYDQKLIGYMYAAVEPQLNEMCFPLLIGEGRIKNVLHSGSSYNAARAAEQINGATLEPGATFSFYEYVIPAEENGYTEGLTLITTDEGSEWQPDIGGGICLTATALNNAVAASRLEVVERHHHTEDVSYAEKGQDTAVARSAGWDYRFMNTTGKTIEIIGQQDGDYIDFKIYALLNAQQTVEAQDQQD